MYTEPSNINLMSTTQKRSFTFLGAFVVFVAALFSLLVFLGNQLNSDKGSSSVVQNTLTPTPSGFSEISSLESRSGQFLQLDEVTMQYIFLDAGTTMQSKLENLQLILLPLSNKAKDEGVIERVLSPVSSNYNQETNTWLYKFIWEDSGVFLNTQNFTAFLKEFRGEYFEAPKICIGCGGFKNISNDLEAIPAFTIVKTAIESCAQNGDSTLHYTVRVKNIGLAMGVVDYIEDFYPSALSHISIVPKEISGSGVFSGGTIKWTDSEFERTFAPGQVREYRYKVTIPKNFLVNFSANGIINTAYVFVNGKDSFGFTLRNIIICGSIDISATPTGSVPTPIVSQIPKTDISNSFFFITGLCLILFGVFLYVVKPFPILQQNLSLFLVGKVFKKEVYEEKIIRRHK